MKTCGICDEELKNDDKIVACNECNELYHLECFEEIGGCANPNCENYVEPSLSLGQLSQGNYADEFESIDDLDDINDDKSNEESNYLEDDINDFNDTPTQKSSLAKLFEWLIFLGLITFAIFLIIELFN